MWQPHDRKAHVSQGGLELIKHFEGCQLTVYEDVGGNATVGYGHRTARKIGSTITQQQADKLLMDDVRKVQTCIREHVDIALTRNEYDALASLIFNVGCQDFTYSSLLWFLNHGDKRAAAMEFPKWVHSRGRIIKGLINRRQAEQRIFRYGYHDKDTGEA